MVQTLFNGMMVTHQTVGKLATFKTHHFRNLICPLFGSIISAINNTLASKNG